MSSKKPTLSIITATYQSAKYLPDLIASLQAQTCQDFEWIIADGNSTDGTVEKLKQVTNLNIFCVSEHDFGIYDAMNKAIKRSTTDYYLVVGSDDVLAPDAVEVILDTLYANPNLDVLIGTAYADGKIIKRNHGSSWFYGAGTLVNAHSVGTVFLKQLHSRFGYYSNHYPISADGYFIKTIFQSNQIKVKYYDQVHGSFGTTGISSTETLRSYVENLHIQLVTEKYKFIQILLFIARYIKYRLK